jgi:hypothetical protein
VITAACAPAAHWDNGQMGFAAGRTKNGNTMASKNRLALSKVAVYGFSILENRGQHRGVI